MPRLDIYIYYRGLQQLRNKWTVCVARGGLVSQGAWILFFVSKSFESGDQVPYIYIVAVSILQGYSPNIGTVII